jgi:3-dehydroquinate dehydratase-1
MTTCSIGNCILGNNPGVVAIVDRVIGLEAVKKLESIGTDILEIRVDCLDLSDKEICDYIKQLRSVTTCGLLGTVRANARTANRRLDIFKQIIPLVDAIDIEIDADINAEVIALAQGKTIIVSEHDYNATPDLTRLNDIVDTAIKQGANIIKIAAMANSRADVVRLLEFTRSRTENMVIIAMGDEGTISRITAPLFGSLFSFGFIEDAVAPGQLPVWKLIEELRLYYPAYDENCIKRFAKK